jgi:hypothetical protein
MKDKRLIVGLGLAGLVAAGLIAPSRARARAEQPAYDLLERLESGVVIRHYGPRLAARTPMAQDDDGPAFRRLAAFIFGGNRGKAGAGEDIGMTSPVEVGPVGLGVDGTMRFFMPARFTADSLPQPDDARVTIEQLPAQTLAVLRFAGSGRGEAAAKWRARLLDALASSTWRPKGEAMMFFYDAPWVPGPLRRNEIVVEVERAG